MINKYYIVLCKNKKRAKALFERAVDIYDRSGTNFRFDRIRSTISFEDLNLTARIVSAIVFYNDIRCGSDSAVFMDDDEFEQRLDSVERRLKEKEARLAKEGEAYEPKAGT